MQSGQFVRGKIDGIQRNYESPDLDQILPQEKLAELADYSEVGEYTRFFKKERVLTKTVVVKADNSDGRRGGVINHTVMYQWAKSFTHDTASYVFDVDKFIDEIIADKRKFKMPLMPNYPMDKDFALIDAPPQIEWEVTP